MKEIVNENLKKAASPLGTVSSSKSFKNYGLIKQQLTGEHFKQIAGVTNQAFRLVKRKSEQVLYVGLAFERIRGAVGFRALCKFTIMDRSYSLGRQGKGTACF